MSRSEWTAWLAVLVVAWVALAFSGYRSRDPDSGLHVDIEIDQAARPARAWIAPRWAGHWNLQGLYREHPVGTFVPPVVLARLGYPAGQAGYAINALYQVLGLLLLVRLAACFVPLVEARPLLWLVQLVPIAFTYRVRANHEQAVLLFLLAALYSTERARRRPAWVAAMAASALGMMLVKGVFALLVPASCAAWLLATPAWRVRLERHAGGRLAASQGDEARSSDRYAWAGVALSLVAVAAGAAVYEQVYRTVTGESFLAEYLGRQLGVAARQAQAGVWIVVRKGYNLGFYVVRVAWFAFPWSVLLAAIVLRRRERPAEGSAGGRQGGRRSGADAVARWSGREEDGRATAALAGVVAVAVLWVAGFSLSDRLADRFVFPVYYLVAAAGAVAVFRSIPSLRARVLAVDRRVPLLPQVLWLALLLVQLVAPRLGLPYINR